MNATRTFFAERKQALATSLRLCTVEGLAATPLVTMSLPVNVVLAALYTKVFSLPNSSIGLITALPFVCNFLQIAITPFLARWQPPKTITLVAASLHVASWVTLAALLPFIPRDDHATAVRWIATWFFISSFCSTITGVSWSSWIQEWIPPRLRGKYFGRRNRLLQVSNLSFLLLAGWALARWDYAIPVFQGLILLAAALRGLSIYWQAKMPTRPRLQGVGLPPSFLDQVRQLRAARSFLRYVAFGAVWSFAANSFGAFYHVFMFEQLTLSAFDVGIFTILAAVGAALTMPAWGQLLDRYGNKSVMAFSLILWQVQNLLWCVLTPDNWQLLYGMWLWGGMTCAGFMLGMFTLQLKLIPPSAKNLAIGFNLALTSLVAAVAPVVGGSILTWALTRFSQPLTVYHICFLAQPLIAIAAVALLIRVQEPAASPFTSVVGAMRNIRTLSGVFGLGFFTNYVFYRARK